MKGLLNSDQQVSYRHTGNEVVESDKNLVKNVLINLVSNAIKFSGKTKPIIVKSEVSAGVVEISIRDEGIGISKEDTAHLFSSFFRGKNAINIQGTGLGLHIVKRYLDLLGGTIELDSELGKGTTITLRIPAKQN